MADLVETVDIPRANAKDGADADADQRPTKRTKHDASAVAKIGIPPAPTLIERMHAFLTTDASANYLGMALPDGAHFKCITNLDGGAPRPGRSAPKVTKFVLQTKTGAQDFCLVARCLFPRCSAEQCAQPSQFSSDNSPVDVSLCLASGGDEGQMAQCETLWPGYGAQSAVFKENANKILALATKAVADLMRDKTYDQLPGVDSARRKKLAKGTLETARAWLDDNWGSQLAGDDKDYFTAKKRCYDVTMSQLQALVEKGASSSGRSPDENAAFETMGRDVFSGVRFVDGANERDDITAQMWQDDALAPSNGDLVACYMSIKVILAAGNYHISPELKSCIILDRRDAASGGGGGGFSAALKAIGM